MRFRFPSRPSVLLLSLAPLLLAGAPTDQDAFRSDAARLELRKPSGWHFQSIETALANRATVKMNDKEFQKAIEQMASAPIVIASKHAEPYDKLNPSFQVIVRPAGPLEGKTGSEILGMIEPTLKAQFADLTSVGAIRETSVGGKRAARLTIRYTLRTQDGREYPTQATLVTIPRGKVLYQFGFSGPPDGPDAITTEVDTVLASVRFVE